MEHIEIVEKLRARVELSYEEAKAALIENDWDLLETIVKLERDGKVQAQSYRTKVEEERGEAEPKQKEEGTLSKVWAWCRRVIARGNENHFRIMKHGKTEMDMPVTAFVLLLVLLPYVSIPLLIIGLFCGFSYRFIGEELGRESVNAGFEKAKKMAEAAKEEFQAKDKQDKQEKEEN